MTLLDVCLELKLKCFGLYIGRCGSVFGALIGSIVVVGIKYVPYKTGVEKKPKFYANVSVLHVV
jgi:hypothetical protein